MRYWHFLWYSYPSWREYSRGMYVYSLLWGYTTNTLCEMKMSGMGPITSISRPVAFRLRLFFSLSIFSSTSPSSYWRDFPSSSVKTLAAIDLFRLQSNMQNGYKVLQYTQLNLLSTWLTSCTIHKHTTYTPRDLTVFFSLFSFFLLLKKKKRKCPNDGVKFLFFSLYCVSRLSFLSFLLFFSHFLVDQWPAEHIRTGGGAGVCCWLTGMRFCRVIRFRNSCRWISCDSNVVEPNFERKICCYITQTLFQDLCII